MSGPIYILAIVVLIIRLPIGSLLEYDCTQPASSRKMTGRTISPPESDLNI